MTWACALKVLDDHGARAPVFVAERIGALAVQGDGDGIAVWKAIAGCLDVLARQRDSRAMHRHSDQGGRTRCAPTDPLRLPLRCFALFKGRIA